MTYRDFQKREYRKVFPIMATISAVFILFALLKDIHLVGFRVDWFLIRIAYIPITILAIQLCERSKFFNRYYELSVWVSALYVAAYATYFSQSTGHMKSSYALAIVSAIAGLCLVPVGRFTFYGIGVACCAIFIEGNALIAPSEDQAYMVLFPYLPIICFFVAIYEVIARKRRKEHRTHEKLAFHLTQQAGTISRQSQILADSQTDIRVGRIASQVGHDIQSPLGALAACLDDLAEIKSESVNRAQNAVGRLKAISDKLLESRSDYQSEEIVMADILPLVQQVIDEKTMLCALTHKLLALRVVSDSTSAFCAINPLDFTRVLSNILQNSIESIENRGTIEVRIEESRTKSTLLVIEDDGRGIPADVLPLVFERGFSHSKKNGHGLGLSHARDVLTHWDGGITIAQRAEGGTKVTLSLPKPVAETLKNIDSVQYVLLDDNALTHASWAGSAKKHEAKLIAFFDSKQLIENIPQIPKNACIYVDYKLGCNENGVKIASDLKAMGFGSVFLATGMRNPEVQAIEKVIPVVTKEPPWLRRQEGIAHATP